MVSGTYLAFPFCPLPAARCLMPLQNSSNDRFFPF